MPKANPDVDPVLFLTSSWWSLLLRGIAAALFGFLVLTWPAISLQDLALLFAVYALVDGVLAITAAIARRKDDHGWWIMLIQGLIGVLAGFFTILWPGITAFTLVYVIAAWAIATGIMEIATAIRLRRVIAGEWLLALSGVASILFGVLLALFPREGALTLVTFIGGYAIIVGILLIALGVRMRKLRGWADEELRPIRAKPAGAH